jgi:hypothetical protein
MKKQRSRCDAAQRLVRQSGPRLDLGSAVQVSIVPFTGPY